MAPVAPDVVSSAQAHPAGVHVVLPTSNDKDAPLKESTAPVLHTPTPNAYALTPWPHVPPEVLYTP
eukprot:1182616-Prymnesium_polylepis.1